MITHIFTIVDGAGEILRYELGPEEHSPTLALGERANRMDLGSYFSLPVTVVDRRGELLARLDGMFRAHGRTKMLLGC